MAKAGDVQTKTLAIVRSALSVLEGVLTIVNSNVSMRCGHSYSSTICSSLLSPIFCVSFSRAHIPFPAWTHNYSHLISLSKDSGISHASALQYASGLVIVNAISIVANNQLSLICYHNAMKIRVAVCSLVYKKVLRMSQSAMGDATPGKIINLLSNDVNRFDSLTKFGSALWTSPILVIAVGYLLLQEAQWAGLIGMAIVFIIVPIQSECILCTFSSFRSR